MVRRARRHEALAEFRPGPLVIPDAVRASLHDRAREAAPREACGLVLLDGNTAVRDLPCDNLAPGTARFRLGPPPEAAQAIIDGASLAVWHSHPAGDPRPTASDVEGAAAWQGRPYLVFSLERAELAAWLIVGRALIALPVLAG